MDSGTEGNIEDETNVESGDEADNEELSSNSKGSVEGSSGAREERLSGAKKPKLEMEAEAKTDKKKKQICQERQNDQISEIVCSVNRELQNCR